MAHAIGCLGTAVGTYRTEKKMAKIRERHSLVPLRNQNRKLAFALVSHPETKLVKVVKYRVGMLAHLKTAYCLGKVEKLNAVK